MNRKRILTLPNILSALRIAMIPLLLYLYAEIGSVSGAVTVLLLSGLTDILDGYIARHYDMVSELGMVLDPVADKLTQAAIMICLAYKHKTMLMLLGVLAIKESINAAAGLAALSVTGSVMSAEWHGKVSAVILYAVMMLHLVLNKIPFILSAFTAGISAAAMILSCALYLRRNIRLIREHRSNTKKSNASM